MVEYNFCKTRDKTRGLFSTHLILHLIIMMAVRIKYKLQTAYPTAPQRHRCKSASSLFKWQVEPGCSAILGSTCHNTRILQMSNLHKPTLKFVESCGKGNRLTGAKMCYVQASQVTWLQKLPVFTSSAGATRLVLTNLWWHYALKFPCRLGTRVPEHFVSFQPLQEEKHMV